MSQELIYNVRFLPDKSDIVDIEKELTKLKVKAQSTDAGESPKLINEATKAYKDQESTLKTLSNELKAYKENLADIQQEVRNQGTATKSNIDTQRALTTAISEVKSQLESATRGNLDYETSLTSSATNLREMKAQLRAIKLAIDEVKDPLGQGAERLEELTNRAGNLNKKLKDVDAQMGVFSRNVGNYSDATDGLVTSLRGGANVLAIFQGPLGPLAGRINASATAISRLKQAQDLATVSTSKLRIALTVLSTTGLLVLITALASLITFFKKTEKGQQALRVATAALSAIFGTLTDIVVDFGEKIFEAIKNPKQAIIDLGNALVENIANRFKAIPELLMAGFNVISNGAKGAGLAIKGIFDAEAREKSKEFFKEATSDLLDFGNAFLKLNTGVDDVIGKLNEFGQQIAANVSQNTDLERSLTNVLMAERELGVERAKQNRDLQQARDAVRDLNVPFEERLEALDRVRKAEEELLQRELDNQQERLRIMTERNDMFSSTEEQNQAVADQQKVIFDLEKEALQRSMSLRRDENAIIRQRDEFVLRGLRRTIANADRERQLEFERIRRDLEEQGKLVEIAQQKEVEFLDNKHKQQQALEEAYFQELRNQYVDEAEARSEAANRASQEIELKGIELRNNVLDAEEQRRRSKVEENANFDRMVAQRQLDAELHELQLKNDRIGAIEAERRAFIEEFEREHNDRLLAMTKELTSKGIKEYEARDMVIAQLNEERLAKEAQFTRDLNTAEFEARSEMINAVADLTKNSLNAIFGDTKAVAVASAIIDTYKGITAALGMSPFTPLNFVNAAAVGAAGFANVRKIMSTQIGSSSVDTSSVQVTPPTPSFGLVDLPGLGAEMASQQPPSANMQPNIILEGEFDPEFLSVKVRRGNDTISGNTIGIGI